MKPILSVSLSGGYKKQTVLDEVTFDLRPGERLGLLGPSGTGKSTLLLALLGLLPLRGGWARGEVLIQGRNMLALSRGEARQLRGKVLSLVPQSPLSALNPALTLQTHFAHYWRAHCPSDKGLLQSRMQEILHRVQLPSSPEFLRRKPGQISAGQAQRLALALALLHRPAIIIADEPTSSLDPVTQTEVLNLLRETSERQGTAVLFVSHDLLSVLRLCSEISVLAGGRIAERLAVQDIVSAKHEALKELLKALPVPAEILLQHTGRLANGNTPPHHVLDAHSLPSEPAQVVLT